MQYRRKLPSKIDIWLQWHFKRYKLWRISKALGIKPYPWQKDFALGKTDSFGNAGIYRQSGKTTAVMLRILVRNDFFVEPYMFADDPDWLECDRHRACWFNREYWKLAQRCIERGIFIPMIRLRQNQPITQL